MRTVVATPDDMIDRNALRGVFGEEARLVVADLATETDTKAAASMADALITDINTPVSRAVIEAGENLEVVARAGVGIDNIDVTAAADHGVTVVNVPEYCTEEVSTHAVSLLLSALRRLGTYDDAVKGESWTWTDGRPVRRLAGRTVGFLGFGGLAQRAAEKFAGFGVDMVAADPYVDVGTMREYGVDSVPFDTLLDRADHICVFAPLTDETHHMFDREAFRRMEDDAILVNVGRGPIVDEDALVWALEHGQIAGAGLDVMEEEPPEGSALLERDDVVLTPHAAFYSEESLHELNEHVAEDVLAVFEGERPDGYIDPEADWL